MNIDTVARGLGWFSFVLGAGELLAGPKLAHGLGIDGAQGLVRPYGVREIVAGAMIVTSSDPLPGIIARVAGDALDVVTLAPGLLPGAPKTGAAWTAAIAVAPVIVLDVICLVALLKRRRAA
ncbi:hypothetical protein [Glacieibacterium frigidum]|uniref:Uncharacterized protein n=1 Tax=Glacieibacterium frigidum TaxID=2593303 RepID=A0A552U8X0_9SPHN|nr:hypothetical protein [Glacieibacterium frigidum]TRW14663.1 hypothetical protein FMM06_13315 [Glacieibacterium frigidum]